MLVGRNPRRCCCCTKKTPRLQPRTFSVWGDRSEAKQASELLSKEKKKIVGQKIWGSCSAAGVTHQPPRPELPFKSGWCSWTGSWVQEDGSLPPRRKRSPSTIFAILRLFVVLNLT